MDTEEGRKRVGMVGIWWGVRDQFGVGQIIHNTRYPFNYLYISRSRFPFVDLLYIFPGRPPFDDLDLSRSDVNFMI